MLTVGWQYGFLYNLGCVIGKKHVPSTYFKTASPIKYQSTILLLDLTKGII